jgi:hypothetical protein
MAHTVLPSVVIALTLDAPSPGVITRAGQNIPPGGAVAVRSAPLAIHDTVARPWLSIVAETFGRAPV